MVIKKNLTVWIVCGFNFTCIPSFTLASSGTEGAAFLDIPVGAGPAALGAAYTSLATDAYAPTWNPAGLGRVQGTELAVQHLAYLESLHYEYLSLVRPLHSDDSSIKQGIGVSMQYLGSGDINRTDINSDGTPVNNGDPIGTYSSHFASYNISYGRALGENLALGITGKLINAKIDNVSANAFAADMGALYKATDHLQLGASLVNIGTRLKFINDGDSLPLAFKAGAAYSTNKHDVISTEVVYERNGTASFHVGNDWRPIEMLSFRTGFRTDTLQGLSPLAGFSTGFGLHLWGQEFDYAWTPYGELGDAQYLSLVIHFDTMNENRRNLIQYQTIKSRQIVHRSSDNELEYEQLMQLLNDDRTEQITQNPVYLHSVYR